MYRGIPNKNEKALLGILYNMYHSRNKSEDTFKIVPVKGIETIEAINFTTAFNAHDQIDVHKDLRFDQSYIQAEIDWYTSQSTSNAEIGKHHHMWLNSGDQNGMVNSNYGFLLFSPQNGHQYYQVLEKLKKDPHSRQAVAYYTNPMIHYTGGKDHICTAYVSYVIRCGKVHAIVSMRSCDIRRGLVMSDLPWQQHILKKLASDLSLDAGEIHWHAVSLHMYSKYFYILEDLFEPQF